MDLSLIKVLRIYIPAVFQIHALIILKLPPVCLFTVTGRKFRLGEENIDLFYETLKADVMLLASLNIMDYSLLVRILSSATLVLW